MMSYAEFERRANDRVEELLEAYAGARLEPTGAVLARIRGNVLASATAAATARLTEQSSAPRTADRLAWLQSGLPRRAVALGLTATFALGTTTAVLAAPPGSAFYNARLVIEAAFMPIQPEARLGAYEDHLVQRLDEAAAAAAAGDGIALAAALAAYQSDVAAAVAAVGNDADLLARLEAMLGKHTVVLEALEARVPAAAAVDNAIASSEKAIAKIKEKAASIDANGGSGGGSNGGGSRPSHAANTPPAGPPGGPGRGGQP